MITRATDRKIRFHRVTIESFVPEEHFLRRVGNPDGGRRTFYGAVIFLQTAGGDNARLRGACDVCVILGGKKDKKEKAASEEKLCEDLH